MLPWHIFGRIFINIGRLLLKSTRPSCTYGWHYIFVSPDFHRQKSRRPSLAIHFAKIGYFRLFRCSHRKKFAKLACNLVLKICDKGFLDREIFFVSETHKKWSQKYLVSERRGAPIFYIHELSIFSLLP